MTAAELFNICEQFKTEHGVDDTLTVLGSIFDTIAYESGIEIAEEDDEQETSVVWLQ